VGWKLSSDISATVIADVWKHTAFPATNTQSLGTTKPAMSATTSNSGVPDWSVTEISAGDWIAVEIEANDLSKCIDLFLIVRRR
jgi:hypothetical protein